MILHIKIPGWSLLITVFCLFLFTVSKVHGSVEDAFAAFDEGNFVQAYTQFKELAEQGDIEAQYNVAIMLKLGTGVMQNQAAAAKWFRKAADKGMADAQFNLGYLYDNGIGVEQNYEYAAVWYKKAAMQGSSTAQANLAVLYANGQGVPQDLIKAYVWSNLAASQGVGIALNNREILAREMSPEMLKNMRNLSQEYFEAYVAPFQTHKFQARQKYLPK